MTYKVFLNGLPLVLIYYFFCILYATIARISHSLVTIEHTVDKKTLFVRIAF